MAIYGGFASCGHLGTQEIEIDNNLVLPSVKVVKERVSILLSSTKSGQSQIIILDKNFKEINKVKLSDMVSYSKEKAV